MKERRAVGHVLRHLTGTPDEREAIEADVLANERDLRKVSLTAVKLLMAE